MPQARRKKTNEGPSVLRSQLTRGIREGALYVLSAVAVYLALSLLTYSDTDPGWSYSESYGDVSNVGGVVGAWFADVSLYLFGYFAYLFPLIVGYSAWLVMRGRAQGEPLDPGHLAARIAGYFVALSSGPALAALHVPFPVLPMPTGAGGVIGVTVSAIGVEAFSFVGATLLLLALFLTGVTLATGLSWFEAMDATGRRCLLLVTWLHRQLDGLRDYVAGIKAKRARDNAVMVQRKREAKRRQPPRIKPAARKVEPSPRAERERQVPMFETSGDGQLPALSLLEDGKPVDNAFSDDALQAMSKLVEIKLADFGVEAEVVAVYPGPVITRFELQPAPGIKVSKIVALSKDLARALSLVSVRVVEIIPGKSVIGLEIPNESREIVTLGDILKSRVYDESKSMLTLALGKDVAGEPVVADLAKMPHLLVAGTTGSGKSVAVNAMILSMLYKATPAEVRLIMIDPKMLELSVYEGIPHLLTEVVTDMKEAANALRWCVVQMDYRYRLMATLGVRNIAGFNRKVQDAIDKGKPILDPLFNPATAGPESEPEPLQTLPTIVVVIDELADMMMIVGKKVDELIARLAQKARASGIHLILATQRPSVDVITGLIKANIPARIAFQVSSKIDSRTILDQMGAEALLGQGDMLYQPSGSNIPTRVHGAFVDDHEVHAVVAELKKQGKAEYLDEVLMDPVEASGPAAGGDGPDESDPLYDEAIRIVTESRRASISGVQRRLKIGYNRAARMIEAMEAAGVVSPPGSNGNREVLAPPPPEM
ncbi:MAG TPA: DNA translocase FtsK [Chromatiaceae bacterium]|nr:DNA translocase FtsK [Chromatiaceae bacterium]HIA08262.1 DNA translocase FtsK [Chromatiaceae bacterium]